MSGFDKLELSTETLRDLTRAELQMAAGGASGVAGCLNTGEIYKKLSLNCYSWQTEQCAR